MEDTSAYGTSYAARTHRRNSKAASCKLVVNARFAVTIEILSLPTVGGEVFRTNASTIAASSPGTKLSRFPVLSVIFQLQR